ncbi:MAG: toxin HicA [Nitrospira sp. SB0677_bin_15]|nr:toxin HicA [Nitrospira sp. SB0667_bin_9]MYD30746.1 toxin HicA [Nitrospira sp. SB0661_bin_20]MYG39237.1 toxin HicA [Nitrospira sp. SB0677_bin_15]MYH01228.1 toxin HicA [Nitrospira sp. SB0675_bin_23]MYJ23360.1 toxin HicA [Nitrospira sp. SB0673_bin_12]
MSCAFSITLNKPITYNCHYFFGEPRQTGSSHRIYKTPWQGDPRINIQNAKGMAKPYQVRQVLRAIARLESES